MTDEQNSQKMLVDYRNTVDTEYFSVDPKGLFHDW